MNIRLTLFSASLLCFLSSLNAQKDQPKIKFGDVKPEDFAPAVYSIDSSAGAVVLADIGSSVFQGNNKGDFSLIYDHIKRIRIMNKNGFEEATVEIPLYIGNNSAEEDLQKLEAVTYNMENGKVTATPLDKASVFKDKYDEHHTARKFTFPNIKEGSIIEYHYTISSPYYANLQPWEFQGIMPRLWSEYTVTIPNDIFDFVVMRNGYLPYVIDTSSSSSASYILVDHGDNAFDRMQTFTVRSNTVTAHWAMQDVPALKPEKYITSMDNYISKIEFQLKRIKYSESDIKEYMGNWNQLVDLLMKDEDFGASFSQNNGWMNDDIKKVTAGAKDDYEKAKKLYDYIRDNFTCTKDYGKYLDKPLKKVFQDKNGTEADINLLLVAAMKNLGYEATPALLSTRDNGRANEVYPLVNEFNYVLCRVKINDDYYLLDATDNALGFGKLSPEMYNGSARVIDETPILVSLSADSIKESSVTSVFMVNDSNNLSGTVSAQYGNFESMEMRQKLSKMKPDDYLKEIKKEYNFDVDLNNIEIDSLKIPEEPVSVKYDIKFSLNGDDIVYFNPMMDEIEKTNPFVSAERYYPVEMNSCLDQTYILNMEVPAGYKVDELPKSARVTLNESDGMFEYIIAEGGGRIQLRCRVQLKKATYEPDDYQTLRDFYALIVKKEAEPVVFSKIK